MKRYLQLMCLALVIILVNQVAGISQTINNNNATTQQQQPQQPGFGWGGWMAFLPFPLPPIPLPFFGGFGMGPGAGGQQGAANNQNVIVGGGDNTQMMEMMKRILELLEKREGDDTASGSSELSGSDLNTGETVVDTTENEDKTGEGALNE
ncbi:MAG: hypothetical protein ACOYXC_12180 [Candidatus Rifleibacteriota bacterium]